jgi:arginyl-tRNA--protein-N-Asp/Glu arginylyltransferase
MNCTESRASYGVDLPYATMDNHDTGHLVVIAYTDKMKESMFSVHIIFDG